MFKTFFENEDFNRAYIIKRKIGQNFDSLKETMIILKDHASIEKLHQIFSRNAIKKNTPV